MPVSGRPNSCAKASGEEKQFSSSTAFAPAYLRTGDEVLMGLLQRRPTHMQLVHLPLEVLADLRQGDRWRLDIDPGFDSKHEFWMDWGHFLVADQYTQSAEQLADFLTFDGFDVLLPVPRSHHPHIRLVRLIQSADGKSLTLFLHDAFYRQWFQDTWAARYGFLAVADRYQNYSCDFFLANYYHFAYLVHEDFETAKHLMLSMPKPESRAPREASGGPC